MLVETTSVKTTNKVSPEKRKEYQDRYFSKHRDEINARNREKYHQNKGNKLSREEAIRVFRLAGQDAICKRSIGIIEKGEKECSLCGDTKPLTEYYADYRNRSGIQSRCKTCFNKKARKYNKQNREAILKQNGEHCKMCGIYIGENIKYAMHHVSYEPEVRVLLCAGCHNTLHSLRINKLDYVKKHGSDIAPYMWAKEVIRLYEDNTSGIARPEEKTIGGIKGVRRGY